ncbi:hypothetical protein [Iodobacter ciconiae]|uniref:hypothetical protein n=1 Tax=Iodobacter ciconiae TaxID=2496266 RepID=UPI0013DE8969|nr:hypothetical protein [Iodobacter ciconiae]
MQQAHKATAHVQRFKAQVELASGKTGAPNTQRASNEEATASWSKKLGTLAVQLKENVP